MIKRKTKRRSSELAELDRASREIENRIQELEASLKRPAQQTRMRLDRNTMPPPDRVREGTQNRALRAVVARDGRATNMRRELRENFMLRHRRLLLLDRPPAGTAIGLTLPFSYILRTFPS